MNQQNDSSKINPVDPDVAHRYSDTREEAVPSRLDDAVMREARRAVRADNRRGSFGAWFRPVAFALTVGLSLAVVLELSDSGMIGRQSEVLPDAPAALPPATDATNFERTDLSDLKRREKPGIAVNATPEKPATDDNAATLPELRTDAPLTQRKVEQQPADTEMAQPGESYNSSAGSRAMPDASHDASTAPQSAARLQPAQCDDEARTTAESWWQCIESLRDAGLAEQAERESGELRNRFPDFEMPM